MNAALPPFLARLEAVQERMAAAALRSGRASGTVTLVAVVKSVPSDRVRGAVEAGVADLGENRVQEAEGKIEAVGRTAARWHMIGHLQRNKAGRAVTLFDRVHSVESLELARSLSSRAMAAGRVISALAQVQVSGESTKHGIVPEQWIETLAALIDLPNLAFDGVMAIGPATERPEQARPFFARTRELRDRAERELGIRLPELSMGMSADYEVAIEEGSTMVRIGTALFGPRD